MNQEYFYRKHVIKVRFTDAEPLGWYWEVFKEGNLLADNSKSQPDYPLKAALTFAKRHIDDLINSESFEDEMRVF